MLNPDYLVPKNGTKHIGVCIERVSTEHQDEKSWADQQAFVRRWLDDNYGPDNYELEVIEYRGSGQILDSAEFLRLNALVATGNYDFVIAEDLSRITRRMQAVIFCEEAEALGTRVIGIGDPVDTANEGWEIDVPLTGSVLNRRCPEFEFTTVDGQTVSNKSILGKVTILDIWAVT